MAGRRTLRSVETKLREELAKVDAQIVALETDIRIKQAYRQSVMDSLGLVASPPKVSKPKKAKPVSLPLTGSDPVDS